MSQNYIEFLMKLIQSSILVDGKYQTKISCYGHHRIRFPNNYNTAFRIFNFLQKTFQRDTKLHQKYKNAMAGYIKN